MSFVVCLPPPPGVKHDGGGRIDRRRPTLRAPAEIPIFPAIPKGGA